MAQGKLFIVEVVEWQANDGQPWAIISLEGETSPAASLFCIGMVSNDGVIRLIDFGFTTAQAAKDAYPDAEYFPGRRLPQTSAESQAYIDGADPFPYEDDHDE